MNKQNVRDMLTREGVGRVGGRPWYTALYEQFDILPAATQAAGKSYMWDLTGAGTPTVAFATDGGGLTLGTTAADAGADNDESALWSLASGAWSVPRKPDGTRRHRLASTISTGASIASAAIIWGLKLTDTAVYKTDADQILFVYDTDGIDIDPGTGYSDVSANPTTWWVIISIGGTDYSFNTGVTVAASTNYNFAIEIGTDKKAMVFLNGNLIDTSALPVLTSTASLLPTFRVLERVISATKSATIRNFRYQGV